MENTIPLVSIIVPMRNAEAYISEALRSLLRETEIPIEVIVVNDNSTDASRGHVLAINDARIRIIDLPGCGAPAAMNAGFADARGTIVMHCDADDLYPPNRIRNQVAWLNANPEYDAVCGSYSTIDGNGRLIADLRCGADPLDITDELRRGIVRTSLCTYALRAELFAKIGGFREYFESAYDIDMQLRLCQTGRIGYIPELFYFYRLHSSSITHSQSNVVREFFERTAHEFQKQRQVSGLDELQRGHPPAKPEAGMSVANSAHAHIQGMLLGRAWQEHAEGRKLDALCTGLQALIARPGNLQVWRSLLALVIKSAR